MYIKKVRLFMSYLGVVIGAVSRKDDFSAM